MQRYFKGETTTTIWGRIAANEPPEMVNFVLDVEHGQPVQGARVTAEKDSKKYTATTDSRGRYEISGLTSGTYEVQADKDGFRSQGSYEVQVRRRECAIQNMGLMTRNSVEGSLLDPEGRPIPNIAVFLEKVGAGDRGQRRNVTATSPAGAFHFEKIDVGTYYLVVSPEGPTPRSPVETRFFGGATRAQAAQIEMNPATELRGYNIHTSKVSSTLDIRVTLTWPNGQPVEHALVECSDAGSTGRESYLGDVLTDATGVATWHVMTDRPYLVRVRNIGHGRDSLLGLIEARETLVPAGLENWALRLTISDKDFERHE